MWLNSLLNFESLTSLLYFSTVVLLAVKNVINRVSPLGVAVEFNSELTQRKRRTLWLAGSGGGQTTLRMCRRRPKRLKSVRSAECEFLNTFGKLSPRYFSCRWRYTRGSVCQLLDCKFLSSVSLGNCKECQTIQSGKKKVISWMGV